MVTVSLTKGIYKCFGCGEGGNAVDFLMKHEHYNYPEALRWLAKKYNIVIEEEEESEQQKAQQDEKESLYTLNGFAAKFFAKQLSETDIGKSVALGYCRNRDIHDASIKTFEIGYSPAVTDAFCQYALNNGYRKEQLIKGGLAIDRNGLLYDRFRDRLIFPIHNISGRIVGFGGRIFVNDPKKPKYLNSPESEIYNKSRVLYGLFHGRNAIVSKDNCLIVEGYTDVIALHQAGIKYVVSSSGTALSEEQIRIIKRFTSNITMIFDGDPAGIKASFRGIDMVLKQGMHVNIVPMPDGEDPDSFSKKYRSEEVENYLSSHAENFITFKANLLMTEAGDDPVKRAGVIKDILNSIAVIPELL
ncbi:MAG: DNA primase, partial [Bacteroidales bacterium]|nr:DNA primase [Bacteroidales bacterium]